MQQLGNLLTKTIATLDEMERGIRICQRCGATVQFSDGSWRRPCGKCGLIITLHKQHRSKEQQDGNEKSKFDCWTCLDTGIVLYDAQQENNIYEFAARCICKRGQKFSSRVQLINEVKNGPSATNIAFHNKRKFGEKGA